MGTLGPPLPASFQESRASVLSGSSMPMAAIPVPGLNDRLIAFFRTAAMRPPQLVPSQWSSASSPLTNTGPPMACARAGSDEPGASRMAAVIASIADDPRAKTANKRRRRDIGGAPSF